MKLNIYQVDAFSRGPFTGNPAAVCPLPSWIEEDLMQKIAMENNLSETAFFVDNGKQFEIRWFTPTSEVRLCGHATLATGYVLKHIIGNEDEIFEFNSASGILKVIAEEDKFTLNFPTDKIEKVNPVGPVEAALGINAMETFRGMDDYLLILENAEAVKKLKPDFQQLAKIETRGVIVTSRADECDFISRGFFPNFGINEDPATGSAHTSLTPYWSARLHKTKMTAIQWSDRKGYFECEYQKDRCLISGECQLYLSGTILV